MLYNVTNVTLWQNSYHYHYKQSLLSLIHYHIRTTIIIIINYLYNNYQIRTTIIIISAPSVDYALHMTKTLILNCEGIIEEIFVYESVDDGSLSWVISHRSTNGFL